MAVAANAVIAAGGGVAAAADGAVKALLALPVSGLVSESPLEETAEGFARLRTAMDTVVEWRPPYLVFKACFGATLACNAGPHQTDRGIADGETGTLLVTPALEGLDEPPPAPGHHRVMALATQISSGKAWPTPLLPREKEALLRREV